MSELAYTLKIALRFSRNKKKSNFGSLISIISTLSIALGVSVLIIGLSAMNGFEYELKNRILSVVLHGQITAVNQPYLNWIDDLDKIRQTPGVLSVSPYINFMGLLEKREILKAIQVVGVDLSLEQTVSSLPNFILNDAWRKLKSGNNEIILGQGIAETLALLVKEIDGIYIDSTFGGGGHSFSFLKKISNKGKGENFYTRKIITKIENTNKT
ncbi:MAG: ABC transporter permease, partial [Arsenophonus sp. ER-LPS3-MAG3]